MNNSNKTQPASACTHEFYYFGDQQPERRCVHCNTLEAAQQDAEVAAQPVQAGEAVDERALFDDARKRIAEQVYAMRLSDAESEDRALFLLWKDGLVRPTLAPIASTGVSAPASQVAAQQAVAHGDVVAGYTKWMHDSSTFPHADDTRHPFEAFNAGVTFAAQQAAAVAAPSDYVLMPKRLTAENGAKSEFLGEYKEYIQVPCSDCDDCDDDEDCHACENMGTVLQAVTIEWGTIKRIYAHAVELLAAPAAVAATTSEDAAPVISSYDIEKVKALKSKFVDALIHGGVQCRTCGAISAVLNRIIDDSEAAAMRATSQEVKPQQEGGK